ncbi:MAG: hypothetical protein HC918_08060 [Oscillatoriales cyanobacterium SM2_1_8]|nr:hypothetical protein [Oscillatoriales cyanobacterium SM2_1_8]
MEPIEVRVAQLHQEVCRLTLLVDTLPQRLLELLRQQGTPEAIAPQIAPQQESWREPWGEFWGETHKDVLDETLTPLPPTEDPTDIAIEWQVRRLMARLSYANNRIAQLEEQLSLQQRRRWRAASGNSASGHG